ncbi:MAG: hypothetical protein HQL01_03000 [Nitrospirae bacterium]|nr:hypothetical protein [Nitrospirota bacterium]
MTSGMEANKFASNVTILAKALNIERFIGELAMKLVNSVPTNGGLRAIATPTVPNPLNAPNPEGTGTRVNIYV